MLRKFSLATLLVACMMIPANAGWLDDAVQGAVEQKGTEAVNEGADAVVNNAKNGAPNKDSSTSDTSANSKNKPAKNKSTTSSSNTSPETADNTPPNETAYSKYDFIPGDKVIVLDDFSDTDEGEFPRKWSLDGPKGDWNGAVEVVSYNKQHYLRNQPATEGQIQNGAVQYIRLKTKGDMPEKFTIEFDTVLGDENIGAQYFVILTNDEISWGPGAVADTGSIQFTKELGQSKNTQTGINKGDGKIHHIAVSVNGTFVKAYVDNERVVNDPDAIKRPVKYIGIYMGPYGEESSKNVMFSNFRLAEGGKDIKSALSTDGKIVTHGILFAPGSDQIKPESAATLKMILGLLNNDPALKFSIEGHTDNQGSSATSQPLSEKRAAAVKSWLVNKGIAADRLQTKGWGESKPIDTNATAEGKANNRRVEFVKI